MNKKDFSTTYKLWENRGLSLEMRLSARMMLSGALSAFVGLIICILAHTHIFAKVLCLVLILGTPIIYLIFVPRKMYRALRYSMTVGVLVILPLLWIFGGGLHSGMSIWIVFEVLFFAVSLDSRAEKIAVYLAIFFYILALLSWFLGYARFELPTEQDVYVSVFGSAFAVSFMVVFMTNFQKKLFNAEYETVENQNQELKDYSDKIKKANDYQKVFLANMSHEIRSPMNVVLGFNRLALESFDVDEIHDYLRNVDTAGEALLVIINDILDYSKIEAGKLELFPANYNFKDLVNQCKSSIEKQCESKGLDFEVTVDPNIPTNLYGDSVRIRQCITNLLTNAMKYTKEGGVYLSFKSGGISDDGSSVDLIISVRDTGQGISDVQMDKLFSRFQRLNESTNRSIEGTGLGLALTKLLLDMMNGHIEVLSTENVGSIFTITLTQPIDNSANGANPDSGNKGTDESDLQDMYVLVVDDSKTNLVLMQKILAKFKVLTDTASSGAQTLEMIKNNKYDLILLDHMMPEMDGVETFARMKTEDHLNKETPVIMLTANAMSGAMEEYMALGFNGYLSKPCKAEDLKRELRKWV